MSVVQKPMLQVRVQDKKVYMDLSHYFLSPLFNFRYQMRISSELTTVEGEGEEKLHRIPGLEHDYVARQ